MISLLDLHRWDASGIGEAAGAVARVRSEVVRANEGLASGAPPTSWQTAGAGLAMVSHAAAASSLEDVTGRLGRLVRGLDDAGDAVTAVRQELDEVLGRAESSGFTVDLASGAVTPRDTGESLLDSMVAASGAVVVAAELSRVRARADEVDLDLAELIRQLIEALTGGTGGQSGAPAPPTAEEVAELSYDTLADWTSSDDSLTLYEVGNAYPGSINDLLAAYLDLQDAEASGDDAAAAAARARLALHLLTSPGEAMGAIYLMRENFPEGGVWDMKPVIAETYGISGGEFAGPPGGPQIRADVFGNVNYGVMMAMYGVSEENAIRASNTGGDAGLADPADDEAIRLGYQMIRDHPGGLDAEAYYEYILEHGPDETVRDGE